MVAVSVRKMDEDFRILIFKLYLGTHREDILKSTHSRCKICGIMEQFSISMFCEWVANYESTPIGVWRSVGLNAMLYCQRDLQMFLF